MEPKKNYNWIPPRFWTAPIDTNIFRMVKLKLQGIHNKVYSLFMNRALLGETIPDLTMRPLTGETVRLRDFRGKKHLVLEFGALT